MQTAVIRTAILKGMPYRQVIMRHALRNALIAPFTVIMLQINWLLSGVIVVEFFFAYKGFGALLLEASLNQEHLPDPGLRHGCRLVCRDDADHRRYRLYLAQPAHTGSREEDGMNEHRPPDIDSAEPLKPAPPLPGCWRSIVSGLWGR